MFHVGQKVKTRDGRDARILCTDFRNMYSVVAAILNDDTEIIYFYDSNGKVKNFETPVDLII